MRRVLLAAVLVLACGRSNPHPGPGLDATDEPDAGETPDAPGTQACPAGMHACNGKCADSKSPATCGVSCIPCSPPAGGSATCDGVSCGASCPAGRKLCNGVCIEESAACGGVCPPGTHDCAGNCLSDTAPNSCGRSCMPCATPANGAATCVNGACSVSCQSGYHRCGDTCVSNSDPATCGTLCMPCPIPQYGIATCEGSKCGVACPGRLLCGDVCVETTKACEGVCPAGKHECKGVCVSNMDIANCGTSCTACPVPANGSATCNGLMCGVACAAGFHRCGMGCASNTSTATCGTTSCTPCPVPANGGATCDGTKCGVTCAEGLHACGTDCVDSKSIASCGTRCMACQPPPNAHATCDGTACGYACDAGTFACGDKQCGRTSWEFESGTLEGWYLRDGGIYGPKLSAPYSSGAFAHSGARSLAVDVVRAMDGTAAIDLFAYLCPGTTFEVGGKTVTAFVRIEGPEIRFTSSNIWIVSTADGGAGAGGQVDGLRTGEWYQMKTVVGSPYPAYGVGVGISLGWEAINMPRWAGTIYIDSITVQ
jgi:hypothetical protein